MERIIRNLESYIRKETYGIRNLEYKYGIRDLHGLINVESDILNHKSLATHKSRITKMEPNIWHHTENTEQYGDCQTDRDEITATQELNPER